MVAIMFIINSGQQGNKNLNKQNVIMLANKESVKKQNKNSYSNRGEDCLIGLLFFVFLPCDWHQW